MSTHQIRCKLTNEPLAQKFGGGWCACESSEKCVMHKRLSFDEIFSKLNGMIALQVAASMPLRKQKGEKDTAFVKRIVAAYLTAAQETP